MKFKDKIWCDWCAIEIKPGEKQVTEEIARKRVFWICYRRIVRKYLLVKHYHEECVIFQDARGKWPGAQIFAPIQKKREESLY